MKTKTERCMEALRQLGGSGTVAEIKALLGDKSINVSDLLRRRSDYVGDIAYCAWKDRRTAIYFLCSIGFGKGSLGVRKSVRGRSLCEGPCPETAEQWRARKRLELGEKRFRALLDFGEEETTA